MVYRRPGERRGILAPGGTEKALQRASGYNPAVESRVPKGSDAPCFEAPVTFEAPRIEAPRIEARGNW